MMSLSNESISRGPQQSKNNISITLLVLGMLWFFFSLRDDGCFHCWLMCLVSGSECKHQNSSPTTIQPKNSSPSLSYRSRCSKKLLTWVAFCSKIQLFSTHTAETFQQILCDDAIHMFHTYMLKHNMTITLHHLIHFGTCVWVRNVQWETGACHTLSVPPNLSECLAPVEHCCMLNTVIAVLMLYLTMNACWFYIFCT
jgi:hypothetical protein